MKKYTLFLDIDGVLNHVDTFTKVSDKSRGTVMEDIAPECIDRLAEFLKSRDDVDVVLSSSWRVLPKLKEQVDKLFLEYGIGGTRLPCTEDMGESRGIEIQDYIDRNGLDVSRIAILDDDSDMLHLSSRLVKTDFWKGGLLDKHIELLDKMFS